MMKKTFINAISLALCAAMLLGYALVPGIIPTVKAENAVLTNLLQNASFETLPESVEDWEFYTSNTQMQYTDVYKKSGRLSVSFAAKDSTSAGGIMQTVTGITAGTQYTISAHTFVEGTSTIDRRLGYAFYDAAGNSLATANIQMRANEANGWKLGTVTVTAPANATKLTVRIYTTKGTVATIFVDDVSVTASGSNVNLLKNPGFETYVNDIPGWYAGSPGNTYIASNGVTADDGSNVLKINAYNAQVISTAVEAQPGEMYTASIRAYGTGGAQARLYLRFISEQNVQTQKYVSTTQTAWDALTIEMEAPADAKTVQLVLVCKGSTDATGWYFDNASLVMNSMGSKFLNLNFEETDEQTGLATNWQAEEDANISISENTVFAGSNALMVTDSSADVQQGAISSLTALAGYQISTYSTDEMYYTLTARVKDTAVAKGQIAIIYYNYNFTKIGETTAISDGSGAWQLITAQGMAPEGAAYAQIVLRVGDNATTTGTVYFDDLTIMSYYGQYVEDSYEWEINHDEGNRLYFTEAGLTELKNYVTDATVNAFGVSGASSYATLLEDANDYLTDPEWNARWTAEGDRTTQYTVNLETLEDPNAIPELQNRPGGGNWPYLEQISRELRTRMETLSLAYALTGDTRYADKAIGWALDMCEWEYWTETDYVWAGRLNSTLDTPRLVIGVSAIYDMCYDRMTPEQRQVIAQNIIYKGLAPLYFDLTGPSRQVAQNKYMARCSGLMIGALAVVNEDNMNVVGKYLDRAFAYADWYLDSQYQTGEQEGYSYTNVSVEELMMGLSCMTRITGREGLLDHPYFDEVLVDWVVDFLAPGSNEFPVYSDSYYSGFFKSTMLILNGQTGNGKAGYYLQQVGLEEKPVQALLFTSNNPVITPPTENDYVAYLEKIGYGGLRTGWMDVDQMLYIIGNNSKLNHNQYDQLSFQISAAGKWLAVDPGYDDSTYGDQYGHNTILVDGVAQSVMGEGTLKQVFDNKLYGYLMGSAPGAYGEGVLTQFDRHAIMVNHSSRPYYIIIDELDSSETHTYDWNLNTGGWTSVKVNDIAMDGTSATGNRLTVAGNNGTLFAQMVSNAPMNIKKVSYVGENGTNTLLQFNSGSVKSEQYMTILNTFGDISTQNVYDNDSLLGAKIQYGTNLYDIILLNRGTGTISAGNLSTDGKQASVLGLAGGSISEGYAITEGRSLVYDGTQLLSADSNVSVAVDATMATGMSSPVFYVSANAETATEVSIYLGMEATNVTINGEAAEANYNAATGMLTMNIPEGESQIIIAQEPAEESWSVTAFDNESNEQSLVLRSEVYANIKLQISGIEGIEPESLIEHMGLAAFYTKTATSPESTIDNADALTYKVTYDQGSGYYTFQSDGIPAKNMGDSRWYKAFIKQPDGNVVYSGRFEFSPLIYAKAVVGNDDYNEDLQKLCVALMNYGAEAQKYFAETSDYTYETLMNVEFAEYQNMLSGYDASMIDERVSNSKALDFTYNNDNFAGAPEFSLSLKGAIDMNFSYTVANNGTITAAGMLIWDAEKYASIERLTLDSAICMEATTIRANSFKASYAGTPAKEMGDTVYIVGFYTIDGTTYYSGVITRSIEYYADQVIDNTDYAESLWATMKAMVVYGDYAKTYFAER